MVVDKVRTIFWCRERDQEAAVLGCEADRAYFCLYSGVDLPSSDQFLYPHKYFIILMVLLSWRFLLSAVKKSWFYFSEVQVW